MSPTPAILKRLDELIAEGMSIQTHQWEWGRYVKTGDWKGWVASALNLMQHAFGEHSVYYKQLVALDENFGETTSSVSNAEAGFRVLKSAKADLEAGVIGSLEKRLSGEIFSDFLTLAKNALSEGQKDVAAVLACAALEDTLKKFATLNGMDVDGKTLDNVIGALKGAGHFSGPTKGIVGAMPKIRNHAMHAQWDQIMDHDVASVIGFTEQFLLSNMS